MGLFSYDGITGFRSPSEVLSVLGEHIRLRTETPKRKLMVGVVMSYHALHGVPAPWRNMFPKNEDVQFIFLNSPSVFNVLHYTDKRRDFEVRSPQQVERELEDSLRLIMEKCAGPNLHAIQLDTGFPSVRVLKNFRERHEHIKLIFHVRESMLRGLVGGGRYTLPQYLEQLVGITDYVLFDIGTPLNIAAPPKKGAEIDSFLPHIKGVRDYRREFGIAVAGDFGPNAKQSRSAEDILAPVADIVPDLSVCVWRGVCINGHPRNSLDMTAVRKHLGRMREMFP